MSYRRYAGDRFAGPTGVPTSFPLDVADGAILVTSGDNSTDQALYVKVTGNCSNWRGHAEHDWRSCC